GWYHNLLKHPECELLANGAEGRGGRFVARSTEGADHDRLLALAEGYCPNYAAYEARTNGIRTIPLLRLTPKAV
ncbi:MAG TPA: nitroreductase/quinone reductase family protein, partial [Mycobacterium sp.]|nr:nitroreductase/quinone reductase family protein [Mycobacterium sp.]